MKILRTPEERFATLPFFPWAPQYLEELAGYEGLRLHLVDEGRRTHGRSSCASMASPPGPTSIAR
jgi:hypothetical protein